jgi:hypothetical protein
MKIDPVSIKRFTAALNRATPNREPVQRRSARPISEWFEGIAFAMEVRPGR